jgi:hypothetical protein
MSDSKTSGGTGLLQRIPKAAAFTAVSGLLILGGYGIAAAGDASPSPSDGNSTSPSEDEAPGETERPDAPAEGRPAPEDRGSQMERQAPGRGGNGGTLRRNVAARHQQNKRRAVRITMNVAVRAPLGPMHRSRERRS